MTSFPSLDRIIAILADAVAGLAAFGILVVVLLQVASRLLGWSIPWTEEATRYLFVWMIFLGLAAGFRTVESARVTFFIAVAPRMIRRLALPIYVVSSIGFFLLVVWTGYGVVRLQLIMNETAATLAVPMWLIGGIMPASAVIAILAVIESVRQRPGLIAVPDDALAAGDPASDHPDTPASRRTP
ncbi:TRAP transporter small permease [Methylobrevis pamukkalensis]|uniref:TRAP transporter small permease protein n=1 Tax=Methylobrevis pamukkalensis TaxID=1439726 RepID=A0A1E3GZR7_9HYPH|nr:TRAP transporter small permease [Methylobrevis pamukkalensis]ODN69532.1 Tripartite ATP-independent periplasmic transporter, DctQ component [Methylobrevis pamukkalensis]